MGVAPGVDVVVIGAGQAGLSAAYFLRRAGLEFVVLDANPGPGGAWRHRWPSLRLGRVHGIHDLPGLALPSADPTRPASEVVADYFADYEREFDIPVLRPVAVRAVREAGADLVVEADGAVWTTRAVVNATGTWDKPFWPHYPGRFDGRQLHTAGYRGPEEFEGKRVVVVGGGTSAVQALIEIAEVAAETTWVTRRPPVWHEGPFTSEHGRAAVARVDEAVRAGKVPASVVSVTGLGLTPEVLAAQRQGTLTRHPMFERLVPGGVAWADGRVVEADTILWATGFRHALDHLAPLALRTHGGGIVMDGTRVVADPRVHLVGYGPSASTIGATRAGRAAATELRTLLHPTPAHVGS
ncbi:FAD-dependent oxidoreductase [Actinokineospora auranticolor]|uniref:Cation diffusion facilitator CzcD-associated flavoprotein CzcO n=1 Tax=Actinokineospora auranticolor TaxID=155976 RepID=A0A2S6GVD7_9PSEU|nr:FAD-dependent oxidoreductase [Actinokineospora auranticolor]PPK69163.1 cation diffusion facilitator CzcD-associated flavoprotein CzcO [Actinokineospora auranticolor]